MPIKQIADYEPYTGELTVYEGSDFPGFDWTFNEEIGGWTKPTPNPNTPSQFSLEDIKNRSGYAYDPIQDKLVTDSADESLSPSAYYNQLAKDLSEASYGVWSINGNPSQYTNLIEGLKEVDPKAYYTAKIDTFSRNVGHQYQSNETARGDVAKKELQDILPEAQKAGVTTDEINSLFQSGYSAGAQGFSQILRNMQEQGGPYTPLWEGIKIIAPAIVGAYGVEYFAAAAEAASVAAAAEATGATYTAASAGFVGPSASLVGGANIAAADWAATTYALTEAASTFGMGAVKGAGLSIISDVISGNDINVNKALTGAVTGGVGASAGTLAGSYAAPYGEFASRAASGIAGGIAGGATRALVGGKDVGQGALSGFIAGVSSLPTIGIDNSGLRVLADAAIGGTRAELTGGDFLTGATVSGIRSGVSTGISQGYDAAKGFLSSGSSESQADAEFLAAQAESLRDQPGGISNEYMADILTREGVDPFTAYDTAVLTNQGIGEEAVAQNIAASYKPNEIYTPTTATPTKDSALERLAKSSTSSAISQSILGSLYKPTSSTYTRTKTTAGPSSSSYDGSMFTGVEGTDSATNMLTPALQSSKYELRKFQSSEGDKSVLIPFKDNQPEAPIPEGYKQVEVVGAAKGGLIDSPSTTMVKYSKKPLLAKRKPEIATKKKTTRKGLAAKQS
jgi:hypothetical protein